MSALFVRQNLRLPSMHARGARLLSEVDDDRRGRLFEYALCLLFLLPLVYGVFSMVRLQRLAEDAGLLARDLARMYRQGVDFSTPANRRIALELAHGRGLALVGRGGVAILSRVRVVQDVDCAPTAPRPCANAGVSVIDQQIVIGENGRHRSNAGSPRSDPGTGLVANWTDDPGARAAIPGDEVKPGEPLWICEVWFDAADQPGGIYVRAAE